MLPCDGDNPQNNSHPTQTFSRIYRQSNMGDTMQPGKAQVTYWYSHYVQCTCTYRIELSDVRRSVTHWLTQSFSNDSTSVRENLCKNSKNVKSHVFWILKNVEKRTYSFTGHLITQHLITQLGLPEVGTGKSRSPTSNILLRSVDTRKYATENCV